MILIREEVNSGLRSDLKRLYEKIKKLECKDYTVFVTDKKYQRSLHQNAYWWAVIIPLLGNHLGNSKEEMHTILCWKFLPNMIEIDGKQIQVPGSTRDQTTKQFGELIEEVQKWAAEEHGVYIPDPGEIPEEVIINNV